MDRRVCIVGGGKGPRTETEEMGARRVALVVVVVVWVMWVLWVLHCGWYLVQAPVYGGGRGVHRHGPTRKGERGEGRERGERER